MGDLAGISRTRVALERKNKKIFVLGASGRGGRMVNGADE